MALTLRLSDKEQKALNRVLPEFSTSSGKLKHMVKYWKHQEAMISELKDRLHASEMQSIRSADRLEEVRKAWKVLESIAENDPVS